MAIYDVTGPDGSQYEIEADNDAKAQEAMQHLQSTAGTEPPGFLEKAAGNVIPDVQGILGGLAESTQGPAMNLLSGDMAGAIPKLVKQGQQFWSNPQENLAEMARPVIHPIDYAEEHPVSQAMNIAAIVSPLMKGAAETGAKYAGNMGEESMGRLHGTTRAQFKQMGDADFGEAMRESFGQGDADYTLGNIGRRQAINERVAQLGNDIGDIREATKTVIPPEEMAAKLQERLSGSYGPGGANFKDEGALMRELENIKQIKNPSAGEYADYASSINRNVTKNKLFQPTGVETDVANQLAHLNDETITGELSPDMAEHYGQLKESFGNAKPLQAMEQAGQAKEVTGGGSHTMFGAVKNALGSIISPNKTLAKAGFGLEKALPQVPTAARALGGASIMTRLTSDPGSFGKYANPLLKAAQEGGSQGVAAMHYLLANQYPEYNQMSQER